MAAIDLNATAVDGDRAAHRGLALENDGRVALLSSPQASALIAEWRDLAKRGADDNVFFHPGVLLPAIDHLDGGVRIAVIRNAGGRLIGLAPVEFVRLGRVASAVRLWVHNYAPLGTPLIDAAELAMGAEALVDRLPGNRSLIVPALALDSASAKGLIAAAGRSRRPVAIVDAHRRPMLRRDAGSTDLRAALSPRRRHDYARLTRRLGERGEVIVEATAEPDRVRARFEEFLALESRSRKGRRGTAVASSVATAAFARDVVFNRSERGSVRIASIRLGERPVAIIVCFVAGATAYAWVTAYDEAYARYSPGAQLLLDVAESLFFDPAVEAIDSCAPAGPSLIDHLWPGRLAIGTLVIGPPGGGVLHNAGLAAFKAEAEARAAARRLRTRLKPA